MLQVMQIPIGLASKSPRRRQLLEEAGFQFRLIDAEIEEIYPDHLAHEDVPEYLSREKALAAVPFIRPEEVILAADSLVLLDGQIFGKPTSKDHATEMLHALSGHTHQVITGVTLLQGKKEVTFKGVSSVTMAPLSIDEIAFYIDRYRPYDKAGSYGVQEWIGHSKISAIQGSYVNIMGLPVHLVYQHLKHFIP